MLEKIKAQYNTLSIQMKVVLWFTGCNFLQKGISLIVTPLFTRIMTQEQYGVFSVFQAWSGILIIITTLYLQNAVMNNAFVKLDASREKIVSAFQSLSLVTSGVFFVVYILFKDIINKIMGLPGIVVFAMFIYFMFWAPMQYWLLYKRYVYEYKKPVIATVALSILAPICSLIAVFCSENKAEARILAFVAVNCLFGVFFYAVNYSKDRTFYDKELWKYAISFNLPLIPCFLSETILNQSDRIMINIYCGSADSGIYSIAYSAAQLVLLFSSALNAAFVPWQYRKLKEKDYKQMEKVGYSVLVIVTVILAILIMFAPEVIMILAGKEYMSGVNLIPTLGASVFFNYMYQMFYRIELYYEQKRQSVIATFVSSILNIALNFALIPIMGFVAAGYTTLVAHIVLCLMHFFYYKKICEKEMAGTLIYKGKTMLLISACMLLIAALMTFLYKFTLMRYIVLFAILVCVIMSKRKIINAIKSILR